MDLSQAIIARSDQLNSDDLVGGPATFTVAEVRRGDADQPVAIVLKEWPANRPFKPSKTVVRLLAYAWGAETDNWPENARMTLYRDAHVKWAGQEVGGIRISHLSGINKPLKIALAESKGKKSLHTVQPLTEAAPPPTPPSIRADLFRGMVEALGRIDINGAAAGGEYVTKTLGKPIPFDDMTEVDIQTVITAAEQDAEVKS